MPKSTSLNITQNIANSRAAFGSADLLSVCAIAVTAAGSNLTPGTRTFTAAAGTLQMGGVGAATWTYTASGGAGTAAVTGVATLTQLGTYMAGAGPTAAANAATVDSGTSNATFALTVGIQKTLVTAGIDDSVVKSIIVASTDTAARIMSFWLLAGTGTHATLIGSVNIPASSGSPASGVLASVDLIGSGLLPGLTLDQNGKRVYALKAGWRLMASVPAVTVSTFIGVTVGAEDY